MANNHGGKRAGQESTLGKRWKTKGTLAKEAARELVRQAITEQLGPMIEAQIANATGLKYLVTRERSTGKFIRVTEAMAKHRSDPNVVDDSFEVIEVWEKDPSVQAFTDLLNRAIDKPREQVQEIAVTVSNEMVSRLDRAKLRARGDKGGE